MLFACLCLAPSAGGLGADENVLPRFKLYLEYSGIYEVTYEDLCSAGSDGQTWPSAGIGLRRFGQEVPIWVSDGGDGWFGAGDSFMFVGEMLAGEGTFLNQYSRFNCYMLLLTDPRPARGGELPEAPAGTVGATPLEARFHLEQDRLRLRFSGHPDQAQEIWYWAKLAFVGTEEFKQTLDLRDLDCSQAETLSMAIGFRGWSHRPQEPDPEVTDHRVEARIDGTLIGVAEFNGQDQMVLESELECAGLASAAQPTLSLRVPHRNLPGTDNPVIDVAMLNWIELAYPWVARVKGAPREVFVSTPNEPIEVGSEVDRNIVVATAQGRRLLKYLAAEDTVVFELAEQEESFFVADRLRLWSPEIVLDRPSDLRSALNQADYIMIAHPSLAEAVEPLAALHRERGLAVTVVDVEDIYDEFNGGVVHPRAIRDFLKHCYDSWQPPQPRFVLLVGDASWDLKNTIADDSSYADWTFRRHERSRFRKNKSTPYRGEGLASNRNLVPTWNYQTQEGHAASDNWFVCLEGDDSIPELAIGRLPAVTPEEVAAIIAKTMVAIREPVPGTWHRNLLFITNESPANQIRSDIISQLHTRRGYAAFKIYPQSYEKANENNTRRIIEVLDSGVQVVLFLGHGGRYIWRTGPPDLEKNHDLFTLDQLEELAPNRRLPVVLSMTCYSAPFDHPTADSIGEKLLRIPERGAVAVFAASWRNGRSVRLGQLAIGELTRPGATVGEAIRVAKSRIRHPQAQHTFNLLGDPALPVGTPGHTIELAVERRAQQLLIRGAVATLDQFSGQVLVELVDAGDNPVAVRQLDLEGPSFEIVMVVADPGVTLTGVRAILWSADGEAAIGWTDLS